MGEEYSLRRWPGEVTVQLIGDVWDRDGHRAHLESLLADLSETTGRDIRITDQNGLIRIWLTGWRRFQDEAAAFDLPGTANCRGRAIVYNGEIERAMVHIYPYPAISHALIRVCITQEVTQSFGPMNDIADPLGTVFSSTTWRDTLSDSDRQVLRILYDHRLSPGMTRQQAMPIVRRIAAELETEEQVSR